MTFHDPHLNSMTFQVFHDLYEPCNGTILNNIYWPIRKHLVRYIVHHTKQYHRKVLLSDFQRSHNKTQLIIWPLVVGHFVVPSALPHFRCLYTLLCLHSESMTHQYFFRKSIQCPNLNIQSASSKVGTSQSYSLAT